MRRALATTTMARRAPTNLCAACARKTRLASSSSYPSSSAATSTTACSSTPWATLRAMTTSSSSPSRPQLPHHHHHHQQQQPTFGPASCSSLRHYGQSPSASASASPPSSSTTPAQPLPYYALFPQTLPAGPPPTGPFAIDGRALRREFLQLQAASHPDLHHHAASTASPSSPSQAQAHSLARRHAEALSSHINAAYRTLLSPLLRAQYLLAERYGTDLAGDEASRLTGPPDAALLGEVMAAREAIEDARSEEALDRVRAENSERIRRCVEGLAQAFAREDVAAAVRETVRLRYWENIRESVDAWEEEEGAPVVLQH